ncbi:MAG TPA: ADOP family duplicated permease [Kofleriaceae bacterium]|nr:ADOP family duplicated permease [Kofleriaceae bacterium]
MSGPAKEPLVRVWLADAVSALRALLATPRYSLPALLSLALGIAASTAVFAVFSAIVLRPLPFPNEDELVTIKMTSSKSEAESSYGVSFTYYSEFKERKNIFSAVAAYRKAGVTITGAGGARHAIAAGVTPDFFDMLQPDAEVGRTFTAAGASPDPSTVAVVSHSFWVSSLGGAPLQGTTLIVDGKPKTVVGVIADDRALPARADLWFPIELSDDDKTGRFRYVLSAVGRIPPGQTLESTREMLRAAGVAQNLKEPDGGVVYGTVKSLRQALVGDKRMSAVLMLVAVAAFLLLACANVASMMVTRASLRSRELAIRAAMGAGPSTLARQSGLESVLLCLIGAGAGLALAAAVVSAANRLLASELEYTPARLDLRVLISFVAMTILASIVIGLAPVLHAARVRPMESLRADGRSTSSRASRRFRQTLVGMQIAMTIVLVISATILIRAVGNLQAVDLGIATDAVGVRVIFPDTRTASLERKTAFARALVDRAAHLPGVTAAAIASDLPFGNDGLSLGLQMEPGAPKENVVARLRLVGPDYFRAMAIPILSGRSFTTSDSAKGAYRVIVNRAFATQVAGTLAAVGHRLSYRQHAPPTTGPDGQTIPGAQIWYDIIGVIEDSLDTSVIEPAAPMVYVHAEMPDAMALMGSGFTLVARGESAPDALVAAMTTIGRGGDSEAVIHDAATIGDMVRRSYRQRTTLEQILTAFALASILVAIIGLYGVTGYTVAERTNEIGIRRALGASRPAIIRLILTETMIVVGLGMVVGIICAFSTRSLLASFLYGIEAADPVSYAIVCVGVAVVALLSALAPAWVAAKILPSRALEVR